MKKIFYLIPAFAILVATTGASYAFATSSYDLNVDHQDDTNNEVVTHLSVSDTLPQMLVTSPTSRYPELWVANEGSGIWLSNLDKEIELHDIPESEITGLTTDLSGLTSSVSSNTSSISSLSSSIATLNTKLATSTYYNDIATSSKTLMYNGTTSGGTVTFYLTTDGTSSGTALCPGSIGQVNVVANDPSNNFGLGWTLTNSNKTMTVTANVRSFTTTTVAGVSVLGSSSLSAAPNGTPVYAFVSCN